MVAALAGGAAAGPALAEAKIQRQLRTRLGTDATFAVDLDLGGLELRGLSRTLADERGRISAERIRIRPALDGLHIEIDGLAGVVRRARPKPKPAAPQGAPSSEPEPAPREAADPLAELLMKLRGVPIEIVSHGALAVELDDGLRAIARDPSVALPGDGRVLGRGRFELGDEHDRTLASATLELAALDERPRDVEVRGEVSLDPVGPLDGGGRALAIAGRFADARARVLLREPEGGRASVTFEGGAADEGGRDRVTVDADALPLALLEPIAELLGRRLGDALGERGRLVLDDARLSGAIELVRGGGLTRAVLDGVELTDLTVDSDVVAPAPVRFEALHLDGELGREHTDTGPRNFAQLTVEHRGVAVQFAGQIDGAGLDFDVELPSTPCQAVLDALPGTPAVLAGTELRGDLDARFGLTLDFAALAQARARYLGDDAEALELEEFDAPGELRFALPYLEQCEVVRLGPGVDVAGLAGPYRHRFETGSGREKRRVLALGDADYVELAAAPRVALAFVILEDARFWQHDGFDREQIERAFWFNLLERRVARGASTITQQTARSLWLGIDRSLARKLGEALLAAELERELDKARLLEIYLNIIELGPEVHGVAEAARYHFGKHPRELTLIEALHLASMAPAPVAYARRFADGHIDAQWRDHLRAQVRRLRIRRLISAEQADEAMKVHLRLRRHTELL